MQLTYGETNGHTFVLQSSLAFNNKNDNTPKNEVSAKGIIPESLS